MGFIVAIVAFQAILIIAVIMFIIKTYNKLVKLRNSVRNSFAQIDTQLQRRFDLIPNLVEVVKGVAEHEKDLLENVAVSRAGYMSAASDKEKLALNNQLTTELKTIFAVAESYPELKSNANFLKLLDELSETEDKVAFAKQFYNDAITIYNNKLQMFPSNLVAGVFGFEEEALYIDDENNVPKVKF